jgi:hypothetical protein
MILAAVVEEDTADIKILRGVGRPRKNTRTLNI